MKDFNFNVSWYIAGVRHAGSMSQSKREELWEDLLEERGPIFADHRVKEFVDDLIQYKKIKGDGVDLGGEIDLIARRGEEILLVEVKSQTLDSYQCRYGRWNLRENMVSRLRYYGSDFMSSSTTESSTR